MYNTQLSLPHSWIIYIFHQQDLPDWNLQIVRIHLYDMLLLLFCFWWTRLRANNVVKRIRCVHAWDRYSRMRGLRCHYRVTEYLCPLCGKIGLRPCTWNFCSGRNIECCCHVGYCCLPGHGLSISTYLFQESYVTPNNAYVLLIKNHWFIRNQSSVAYLANTIIDKQICPNSVTMTLSFKVDNILNNDNTMM